MPTSARAVYTVFTKICGEFEIAQMGRCGHRPLQSVMQNRNKLSIPEMIKTEIDAVCPQMRVVHSSEPKAIGKITILRPNRAFRPRSGQKFARVSAQYNASPAPLFAYFFWQDRWNQIANQRSVCNLERTSNGTDETCRLRRGEGCGVCEDEPPEARLWCQRKRGSFGEYGKTARPAAPDGRFEFDFTADSLRPAPSARPCGRG